MCEASVYLLRDGAQTLLLEDVCLIRPDEETDSLLLRNIFGEQRMVRGRVCAANLAEHSITIAAAPDGPDEEKA